MSDTSLDTLHRSRVAKRSKAIRETPAIVIRPAIIHFVNFRRPLSSSFSLFSIFNEAHAQGARAEHAPRCPLPARVTIATWPGASARDGHEGRLRPLLLSQTSVRIRRGGHLYILFYSFSSSVPDCLSLLNNHHGNRQGMAKVCPCRLLFEQKHGLVSTKSCKWSVGIF